ncbi:MAG: hypothetical protein Q4D82_01480 [Neisseria sp.]|nr:hypothetical protein [Neisseria sp.]
MKTATVSAPKRARVFLKQQTAPVKVSVRLVQTVATQPSDTLPETSGLLAVIQHILQHG